jgi:hypothetical protein
MGEPIGDDFGELDGSEVVGRVVIEGADGPIALGSPTGDGAGG